MPFPAELSALPPGTTPEVLALLRRCPDVEPLRYRVTECLVTEHEEDREIFLGLQGSLRVERVGVHQPCSVLRLNIHVDDDVVRAEPLGDIELELRALWGDDAG